ncbi:MAG: hypothetical protein WKI04_14545 [Ferruginibacter sp.]
MLVAFAACNVASAQLIIDNAQFFIQPGATVTVQGDVTSNTDILGTGLLQMKGTALQNLNMNGFTIPNLEIDNVNHVALAGSTRVSGVLTLTNGKLQLGANNFTLTNTATLAGVPGASKFIETNGTGQVIKLLTANVALLQLPLGAGTSYRPVFISTTGTYASASVGARVLGAADPNRPPKISDYLSTYWPVTRAGITGTVTVTGQYAPTDVVGTEANLRGYFFNGTDWVSTGETHDAALNRVSVPVTTATGEVAGMDKFVLARTKVFLQALYNTTTGIMSYNLRTPTNLIPLTDPYRAAPYATNFTHVANAFAETVPATVFANQPLTDNNIVDWVFLELRNTTGTPGANVLQTRSALLKRNGDVVDIDGTSPVTFNNTPNGSYTIAVRHRNHLGISADPVSNLKALAEAKSTATPLDFTTLTDASIFGTSAAYAVSTNSRIMLWGGNANHNANVRYTGIQNDKDIILADLGGASSLTGYYRADINLNRALRYSGISNDKDFLLASVLASSSATTRIQQLPQ